MSHFECTIFFSPAAVIEYRAKAYLHIECRVERTELNLEGTGAGPRIEFNTSLFDMGICGYLMKRGLEVGYKYRQNVEFHENCVRLSIHFHLM